MNNSRPRVFGKLVDDNTRCIHYAGINDIIAIKMKCCQKYYSCIRCHDELEDHIAVPWGKNEFNEWAILCGNCKNQLTINEYLQSNFECPMCQASFNEACKNHYCYYFDI